MSTHVVTQNVLLQAAIKQVQVPRLVTVLASCQASQQSSSNSISGRKHQDSCSRQTGTVLLLKRPGSSTRWRGSGSTSG